MALKQLIDAYELLDSAHVDGEAVADHLRKTGLSDVTVQRIEGAERFTDFVQIHVRGKSADAPTLGIIGKLGGIGARPTQIGIVSDADGAIAAVAIAMKLAAMQAAGDALPGDVILSTHICPSAPTRPHHPVPFMSSPVDRETLCRMEIHPKMEAIISIDTSRGNRIVNHKGIALTPTVKQGYILPVSMSLLDLIEYTTGRRAVVMPLSTQDITPYANELFHVNSIMQPAAYTDAPVIGLALTAETVVPGCATGAVQMDDLDSAVRFSLEVAKAFGNNACAFHDAQEFERLHGLYGSMKRFQGSGCASDL